MAKQQTAKEKVDVIKVADLSRFNKVTMGKGKQKVEFSYEQLLADIHTFQQAMDGIEVQRKSFDGKLLALGQSCKSLEDWENVKKGLYQVYSNTYNNEPVPNAFKVSCSGVTNAWKDGNIKGVSSISKYAKERVKANKVAKDSEKRKAEQDAQAADPTLAPLMKALGDIKAMHKAMAGNLEMKNELVQALSVLGREFANKLADSIKVQRPIIEGEAEEMDEGYDSLDIESLAIEALEAVRGQDGESAQA